MPHKFWYDCDDRRVADATLVWILFFYIFFSCPAPFEPGGHPGEPWPEAAYWSLSWDHISWESGQTAAEILIAFKAGVDTFFFWIFSLCFLQRVNSKSKKTLNIPLPLAIEGLLTELIRCEFFLFLGFLLHSHASTKITKNSLLITEHVRNIFSVIFDIWSSSIFFGNKIGRSFHTASR